MDMVKTWPNAFTALPVAKEVFEKCDGARLPQVSIFLEFKQSRLLRIPGRSPLLSTALHEVTPQEAFTVDLDKWRAFVIGFPSFLVHGVCAHIPLGPRQ